MGFAPMISIRSPNRLNHALRLKEHHEFTEPLDTIIRTMQQKKKLIRTDSLRFVSDEFAQVSSPDRSFPGSGYSQV